MSLEFYAYLSVNSNVEYPSVERGWSLAINLTFTSMGFSCSLKGDLRRFANTW